MALFNHTSLFRPLLIAATGAMLLIGTTAAADPQPRSRGHDSHRARDTHRAHDNRHAHRQQHIRRDHYTRNARPVHHHSARSNVIVNFNSRPYWYGPRPAYYRPTLFYSRSYPTHYVSYSTFRPMLMTPMAYQVFEYTQPHMPVAMNANNYQYTLTPGQVTDAGNGRYCREYQAVVTINNRLQDSYGQACRQPDGSWEILS